MRTLLWVLIVCGMGAGTSIRASAAEPKARVAFIISDGFDIIDLAGAWEVFQDTSLTAAHDGDAARYPFELYTVSTKAGPVSSSGGAQIIPKYTLGTAPPPDLVVIAAQSDKSVELMSWLQKQHGAKATIASICVGAAQLAHSGLIDGKQATTHHEYVERLRKAYPKVEWLPTRRFVKSGDGLYTAGGLTSGIDLALHLVAERYGDAVAQATAEYMEYRSEGWKNPQ